MILCVVFSFVCQPVVSGWVAMQEVRVQGLIPAPAVGEGLLGEVLVYAVLRRGRWKRKGVIFFL